MFPQGWRSDCVVARRRTIKQMIDPTFFGA